MAYCNSKLWFNEKIYTLRTSNRDCCRNLFYLCNQAMINYDAELKKYKMKKWHELAFGSLGRTVWGRVVTRPSPAVIWRRCRTRKTTEKTREIQLKAALASSPLQPTGCLVCSILVLPSVQFSCFIYCIRLLALLLIPRGYLSATTGIWGNSGMNRFVKTGEICGYCSDRKDCR